MATILIIDGLGDRLRSLRVTVSLGVATFPSERTASEEAFIRETDRALYRAKQGGRNRTEAMAG